MPTETEIENMNKKCKKCGHSRFNHGGVFGDGNCLDCDDYDKECYKFEE